MTQSNSSSFAAYAQAAHQFSTLTPELEMRLLQEYKNSRSRAAREQLIQSHMRLVMSMASQIGRFRDDREDIVQEGNIGLMIALEKYDLECGARFAVYAAQWIKARMKQYIRENTRLVRFITTRAHQKCFYNLHRYRSDDRSFSVKEIRLIAEELNVPEQDVRDMEIRLFSTDHSIHITVEEGGVSEPLIDDTADPAELVEQEEWEHKMGQQLIKAVNNLDDRGRHIINGRILTTDVKTLEYFSQVYKVSKEAIRQAELKALSKVKQTVLMAA